MVAQQIHNFILKLIGNTFLGLILLAYLFFSGSIIIITTVIGAKITCDRLEPGYIVCKQDELRIDRLLKREKTSFRLQDVVIKSENKLTGFSYSYNSTLGKSKFQWKTNIYNLYLKTDKELILYNHYTYLPYAEKTAEVIINYMQNKPNPKSYMLNIRNNILEIYAKDKNYKTNIIILILGWIILLVFVRPIFKKINQSFPSKAS